MKTPSVVVIGAGAGGLATAIDLAGRGIAVTVLEAAATPGGKMRQVRAGERFIDAGPTVFTMRWVFESLFADAGHAFGTALDTVPAEVLARHAWTGGGRLDLYADVARSEAAISQCFGPTEAAGFQRFCARSAGMYDTLKDSFMAAAKPGPFELARRIGLHRMGDLLATQPHRRLWPALGDYFKAPQLRQLFGRYATYVGSSPLQTPATLMLIAHVEQDGVWLLPGGMHSLAQAMADLASTQGATLRYSTPVTSVLTDARGRVTGVATADDTLPADAVVYAGDYAALSEGLLGESVRPAVPRVQAPQRGLSAVTWCVVAQTHGFPLHYHNVFFADHYPEEFRAIFEGRGICDQPTVYVCAQDRLGGAQPSGPERLLILINAPADGDSAPMSHDVLQTLRDRAWQVMAACGLTLQLDDTNCTTTSPEGFHALFPGSGGSLYGRASHGMLSSFQRPGSQSRVPGLYLAGGTVHPGPGVPMATLSGRLAAARVAQDLFDRD